MRRLLLSLAAAAFLLPVRSFSQESAFPLAFNTYECDFGEVSEDDGTLYFSFEFVNTSSSPVRISRAVTSCNCVSASFPQKDVAAGRSGELNAAMNLAGMGGDVERDIQLFVGGRQQPVTLKLKASVIPSTKDLETAYHVAMPGGLRLRVSNARLGYIPVGGSLTKFIDIVNDSSKDIRLGFSPLKSGSFLSVECPSVLAPGEVSSIYFTYRLPSGAPGYGSHSDNVLLTVDGAVCSKPLEISCIGVDDFSDEALVTPSLQTYPSSLVLSKTLLSKILVSSFTLSNNGEGDLVIRKLDLPDGVEVELKAGDRLRPGEKRKVTVKSDLDEFRIGIVSNDPVRPYRELNFHTNQR